MSGKAPSIISAVITILLLIIFSVLVLFTQMVALNGASESQGMLALGVSLTCQGVSLVLLGVFASWLTRRLIDKLNWNRFVSVVLSVIPALVLGVLVSFVAVLFGIIIAGIK